LSIQTFAQALVYYIYPAKIDFFVTLNFKLISI